MHLNKFQVDPNQNLGKQTKTTAQPHKANVPRTANKLVKTSDIHILCDTETGPIKPKSNKKERISRKNDNSMYYTNKSEIGDISNGEGKASVFQLVKEKVKPDKNAQMLQLEACMPEAFEKPKQKRNKKKRTGNDKSQSTIAKPPNENLMNVLCLLESRNVHIDNEQLADQLQKIKVTNEITRTSNERRLKSKKIRRKLEPDSPTCTSSIKEAKSTERLVSQNETSLERPQRVQRKNKPQRLVSERKSNVLTESSDETKNLENLSDNEFPFEINSKCCKGKLDKTRKKTRKCHMLDQEKSLNSGSKHKRINIAKNKRAVESLDRYILNKYVETNIFQQSGQKDETTRRSNDSVNPRNDIIKNEQEPIKFIYTENHSSLEPGIEQEINNNSQRPRLHINLLKNKRGLRPGSYESKKGKCLDGRIERAVETGTDNSTPARIDSVNDQWMKHKDSKSNRKIRTKPNTPLFNRKATIRKSEALNQTQEIVGRSKADTFKTGKINSRVSNQGEEYLPGVIKSNEVTPIHKHANGNEISRPLSLNRKTDMNFTKSMRPEPVHELTNNILDNGVLARSKNEQAWGQIKTPKTKTSELNNGFQQKNSPFDEQLRSSKENESINKKLSITDYQMYAETLFSKPTDTKPLVTLVEDLPFDKNFQASMDAERIEEVEYVEFSDEETYNSVEQDITETYISEYGDERQENSSLGFFPRLFVSIWKRLKVFGSKEEGSAEVTAVAATSQSIYSSVHSTEKSNELESMSLTIPMRSAQSTCDTKETLVSITSLVSLCSNVEVEIEQQTSSTIKRKWSSFQILSLDSSGYLSKNKHRFEMDEMVSKIGLECRNSRKQLMARQKIPRINVEDQSIFLVRKHLKQTLNSNEENKQKVLKICNLDTKQQNMSETPDDTAKFFKKGLEKEITGCLKIKDNKERARKTKKINRRKRFRCISKVKSLRKVVRPRGYTTTESTSECTSISQWLYKLFSLKLKESRRMKKEHPKVCESENLFHLLSKEHFTKKRVKLLSTASINKKKTRRKRLPSKPLNDISETPESGDTKKKVGKIKNRERNKKMKNLHLKISRQHSKISRLSKKANSFIRDCLKERSSRKGFRSSKYNQRAKNASFSPPDCKQLKRTVVLASSIKSSESSVPSQFKLPPFLALPNFPTLLKCDDSQPLPTETRFGFESREGDIARYNKHISLHVAKNLEKPSQSESSGTKEEGENSAYLPPALKFHNEVLFWEESDQQLNGDHKSLLAKKIADFSERELKDSSQDFQRGDKKNFEDHNTKRGSTGAGGDQNFVGSNTSSMEETQQDKPQNLEEKGEKHRADLKPVNENSLKPRAPSKEKEHRVSSVSPEKELETVDLATFKGNIDKAEKLEPCDKTTRSRTNPKNKRKVQRQMIMLAESLMKSKTHSAAGNHSEMVKQTSELPSIQKITGADSEIHTKESKGEDHVFEPKNINDNKPQTAPTFTKSDCYTHLKHRKENMTVNPQPVATIENIGLEALNGQAGVRGASVNQADRDCRGRKHKKIIPPRKSTTHSFYHRYEPYRIPQPVETIPTTAPILPDRYRNTDFYPHCQKYEADPKQKIHYLVPNEENPKYSRFSNRPVPLSHTYFSDPMCSNLEHKNPNYDNRPSTANTYACNSGITGRAQFQHRVNDKRSADSNAIRPQLRVATSQDGNIGIGVDLKLPPELDRSQSQYAPQVNPQSQFHFLNESPVGHQRIVQAGKLFSENPYPHVKSPLVIRDQRPTSYNEARIRNVQLQQTYSFPEHMLSDGDAFQRPMSKSCTVVESMNSDDVFNAINPDIQSSRINLNFGFQKKYL